MDVQTAVSCLRHSTHKDGMGRAHKLEQDELIPIHLWGEKGGRFPTDHPWLTGQPMDPRDKIQPPTLPQGKIRNTE